MASSPAGKGFLVAIGGLGGAFLGFYLEEKWMQEHRKETEEKVKRIIERERESAARRKLEGEQGGEAGAGSSSDQ